MCRSCRYFEREKSHPWGFCRIPLPFFVEPDGVVCDDEGADCKTYKGVEDVHPLIEDKNESKENSQ